MDTDINIDLHESAESAVRTIQLPLNFISVGEVEPDDIKIYIKQDIYKQIERFASSNTAKELGSILLGDYSEAMGKIQVVISAWIEAKHTDATASTLTFTHETWDYVHKSHSDEYPALKMLGWQHTHPNYGIFLSNYDLFIQENFFNLPFQVAYVVDPVQHLRGFFQWKSGKIEKLKGFYIYDDVGKPIKIEQAKPQRLPASSAPAVNLVKTFMVVSVLSLLLTTVWALALYRQVNIQTTQQESLLARLTQQEAELSTMQSELADGSTPVDADTIVTDLDHKIEMQQQALDQQASDLARIKDDLESIPTSQNIVSFKAYSVQQGDTLLEICQANGLDYEANISVIQSINGITNVDSIQAGQSILLPFVPKE